MRTVSFISNDTLVVRISGSFDRDGLGLYLNSDWFNGKSSDTKVEAGDRKSKLRTQCLFATCDLSEIQSICLQEQRLKLPFDLITSLKCVISIIHVQGHG